MRFLLLASLLLLVQPLHNIEVSTDLTNESVEALEVKVLLARQKATAANESLNTAKEKLLTLETNATQLNETYAEKKEEWEKLKDLDKQLYKSDRNLAKINKDLKSAEKRKAEIEGRQAKLDDAKRELAHLETLKQTETKETLENKSVRRRDVVTGLEASIGVGKSNAQLDLARKELAAAEKDEDDFENYDIKHAELTARVNTLNEAVAKVPEELKTVNERLNELTTAKEPVELQVNNTRKIIEEYPVDLNTAKEIMLDAETAKNEADIKVENQNSVVANLQKNFNEAEGEVRALEQIIKKKTQNSDVTTAGIPWWAYLIVAVVIILIAGAILYFLRLRSTKQKAVPKEQEATHTAPTSVSKSETPCATAVTPITPSKPVWIGNKRVLKTTDWPHDHEYIIGVTSGEEESYDLDNLPEGMPEQVKEILKREAQLGTKVIARIIERKIQMKSLKNKPVKVYEVVETEFTCKCGLPCRIDEEFNYRCGCNVEQIKFGGIPNLKRAYPPDCDHTNKYENAPPLDRLKEIKYDISKMTYRITGPTMDTSEGILVNDLVKQWKKEARESPPNPLTGHRSDGTSVQKKEDRKKQREPEDYTSHTEEYKQNAIMERDTFDQNLGKHISTVTQLKYYATSDSRYDYTASFVQLVIDKVLPIFKNEKQVIKVSHPCVRVGDIHGEYNNLNRMFERYAEGDRPGWTTIRWVFSGDFVDRGMQSLDCLMQLWLLKIKNPKSIFMLRGNHESLMVSNSLNSLKEEIHSRFWQQINGKERHQLFLNISEVFDYMSLVADISEKILVMHGGISPALESLDQINAIPKPLRLVGIIDKVKSDPNTRLGCDILWSDPVLGQKGYTENAGRGGVGWYYGEQELVKLLKKVDREMIDRGHQVMMIGIKHAWGHKQKTTFSSVAGCIPANMFGCWEVDDSGHLSDTYFFKTNKTRDIKGLADAGAHFGKHFRLFSHKNNDYTSLSTANEKAEEERLREVERSKSASYSGRSSREKDRRKRSWSSTSSSKVTTVSPRRKSSPRK